MGILKLSGLVSYCLPKGPNTGFCDYKPTGSILPQLLVDMIRYVLRSIRGSFKNWDNLVQLGSAQLYID